MPGMGGMPGMGAGGGSSKKRKPQPKPKKKSGNPAKAAQEAKAAELKRQQGAQKRMDGSSFGAGSQDMKPEDLNLPKGFEKYLR